MRFFGTTLFVLGSRMLGQIIQSNDQGTIQSEEFRDWWGDLLDVWQELISESEFAASHATLQRMIEAIKQPDCTMEQFKALALELQGRLEDETGDRSFFIVPLDKDRFFGEDKKHFGQEVADRFPSAIIDIEQAGYCLGCGLGTACVFHLMRVMEVGLRALAKSLKDPAIDPKKNPNWNAMLKKCRDELAKPLAKRSAEWAADDRFFSAATASLMAVKDAWRNPTMHVEVHYDETQAFDIWNHVGAYMRHLPTKLYE